MRCTHVTGEFGRYEDGTHWSMESVRIVKASEAQIKTMRTEMQEPKKFDPEAFHPNTTNEGSM